MSIIVDRFNKIKSNINNLGKSKTINIIAISKTFSIDHIKPLLNIGHDHFGENKVQEATTKWNDLKKDNSKVKLHMVGKLQSNKAKKAVQLFDFIHSLDNKKLADTLSKAEADTKRKIKYFIQVNIGNEVQKSGINKTELDGLVLYCKKINLDVVGLMCIPPAGEDSATYFKEIKLLNNSFDFTELSMGMSSDFIEASKNSATYLRIGSSIFGERL